MTRAVLMMTLLTLSACASAPPSKKTPVKHAVASAVANIGPVSGTLVSGRLRITPMNDGVHIAGELGGLARMASHAIHVHERGDCSAADGSSAGAHFNPTASQHGRASAKSPKAHHAGDMDNLQTNISGVARVDIHLRNVTLGGGAPNDIMGRAIVVHAGPDDYVSQPAGNAGARAGCGVIQVGY